MASRKNNPFWFYIPINPEPWAVGPVQTRRRGGKMSAFMGRNAQLAAFQEAVREAVREEWGELPPFKTTMRLDIYLWRHRAEYKTVNQRVHRKHEADATNMLKAVEDALQGILYENDRDNITVISHIVQQSEDAVPGIAIRLQAVDMASHTSELMEQLPPKVIDAREGQKSSLGALPPMGNNEWRG